MEVLASIEASIVVDKRDAFSFRDAELASALQVYRALTGWKTQDETRKGVQESLSAAWILNIGMGGVGAHVVKSAIGTKQQD